MKPRPLLTAAALLSLILLFAAIGLGLGTIRLSPAQIVAAFSGQGDAATNLILLKWRLPRILMALIIGGALGMGGAIFQSLIRNPLGSPDIIGFSTGAHSGAIIAMILFSAGPAIIAMGAVAGGLATAALVYALAWQRGVEGLRLILAGVAVSAMLGAFNQWLMLSGSLEAVMGAAIWGAGSLAGMGWNRALPSGGLCLLGMMLCLGATRRLHILELGDDVAAALGVEVGRSRLLLMALGTALTAAATAAAGPIAFIALAAPQLAQKLARCGTAMPLLSALTGALLLLGADLIAQHSFAPVSLPVGLVTVCTGGLYLIWLLLRQQRIATP